MSRLPSVASPVIVRLVYVRDGKLNKHSITKTNDFSLETTYNTNNVERQEGGDEMSEVKVGDDHTFKYDAQARCDDHNGA